MNYLLFYYKQLLFTATKLQVTCYYQHCSYIVYIILQQLPSFCSSGKGAGHMLGYVIISSQTLRTTERDFLQISMLHSGS